MSVLTVKARLRERMMAQRRGIPTEERAACSSAVATQVTHLPEFSAARTLALYAATPDEVDTVALFAAAVATHAVYFPRVIASDTLVFSRVRDLAELRPGFRGLLEPVGAVAAEPPLDCVIVPGVAFDPEGTRLGRGAGCYDRWLAGASGRRIGLAFERQMVPSGVIPVEPHDVRMDVIVTEQRVIRCG